jgi:hypothetical protein
LATLLSGLTALNPIAFLTKSDTMIQLR